MVIIIDYGLGNRGSILNVLQRIGVANQANVNIVLTELSELTDYQTVDGNVHRRRRLLR